jgi:uncharacterized protein (DUF433 family)
VAFIGFCAWTAIEDASRSGDGPPFDRSAAASCPNVPPLTATRAVRAPAQKQARVNMPRDPSTRARPPYSLTIQGLLFCGEQAYSFIMLDWSACPAVERQPDRVGGAWVFTGTRVPVRALFENLEEGATLADFLKWFPGVTREQAVAVLAHAEHSLTPA